MQTGSLWKWMVLWGLLGIFCSSAVAADLKEIRERGVIRHLGVPYAGFVTGVGDGFDVEMTTLFAKYLGVRYEYVKTDWGSVVPDLIGKKIKVQNGDVETLEDAPVKGDMIANGFTVLPWRKKLINFSQPIFPNQVWLMARADSKIRPIKPSRDIQKDIQATRKLMNGKTVLSVEKTCLDPALYKLSETGAQVICFTGQLNELAPAVINHDAEMTILDVPDALIALEKWPGKLKIIGPVSEKQVMAAGFPKDAPQLLDAYNEFLGKAKKDGTYMKLIKKYYPSAPFFFPEFFKQK
jgi:ABC-type amino acid transport substrate-binding protein